MANINQCDQSCDIIKRDTEENDSGGLGGERSIWQIPQNPAFPVRIHSQ
jgi:hypothetical protein